MNKASLLLAIAAQLALAQTPQELLDAGHFKRAFAIVDPRLKATPNDAEGGYWMARIKLAFNDVAAATSLAEKAVAADPKKAVYHQLLADMYGQAAQHAGVFKQMSLGKQSKKEMETALALDPNN